MKSLVLGYCPIGNGASIAPFDMVFKEKKDISSSISGVDAVVFWGGTDISPSFYNQAPHKYSQAGNQQVLSYRDSFEYQAMKFCLVNDIPMIGVCRGAQLLCAFAGGKLIQHCDGHVGRTGHQIDFIDEDGGVDSVYATSCHHQMMYPFDVPHEMLAWSSTKQSTFYEDDKGDVDMKGKVEPEIVYFPDVKGLAIQGHPEWAVGTRFADYCNTLVSRLFFQPVEI
tara:strand:+ start:114 stop:788 length:675 start_codon:yes stop_codon:yes gene_type:complete